MKITVNDIRLVPENMGFAFCVFGKPDEKVLEWASYHGLELSEGKGYTNISVPAEIELSNLFESAEAYEYVDGFSPNLNKHLHIGHLSNLVIAKAVQGLGMGNKYIAILGDTLTGDVSKEDALESYAKYCKDFNYAVHEIYMASEMKCDDGMLIDGSGDYEGTKIFEIGEDKIVGLKSTGSSSYFYQDVALASKLNSSTLYLTGSEQAGHFGMLKKLFPHISHQALGLVTLGGKKQSSRNGNVVYATEVMDAFNEKFNDVKLAYNVLAGMILKSVPSSTKSIDMASIDNVKLSPGLYLSYTMARLKSAGLKPNEIEKFSSKNLAFADMKAKVNFTPNSLLESLLVLCKKVNALYVTHHIKDNEENQKMFSVYLDDIELGMKKLGMFPVDKV
jgi:arginyl-tRNA synthetase